MSIYPSPDKLDTQESKYALVILAAKRARQIKDNARRLTDSKSANPLTVALEEMSEILRYSMLFRSAETIFQI